MATIKVSVTYSHDLHQEEFEGVGASMTDDGELWLTNEEGVIEVTILPEQWSAFAVTKEED